MEKTRRQAGDARCRQINRLRRQAQTRTIMVSGQKCTVKVLECPDPMDCTPLESQRIPRYRRYARDARDVLLPQDSGTS